MLRLWANSLLLTVVLTLASAMSVSAQAADYRLYTNPKGYQVEIPLDWLQDPAPDPTLDAHYLAPDHQAEVVLQVENRSLGADLQQALADLSAELIQAHAGFSATNAQLASVFGADAAALGGGAWTEGDTLWMEYAIVATRGTVLYELRLVVTWDYHLAHDVQLNDVLESYQLSAPG